MAVMRNIVVRRPGIFILLGAGETGTGFRAVTLRRAYPCDEARVHGMEAGGASVPTAKAAGSPERAVGHLPEHFNADGRKVYTVEVAPAS